MEQKLDGKRLLISVKDQKVFATSRNGEETKVPYRVEELFKVLKKEWIFDGEYVNGIYWVFDILKYRDTDISGLPWQVRNYQVQNSIPRIKSPIVKAITPRFSTYDKHVLFEKAKHQHVEGVVFKDINQPYIPGRSRAYLKHKFIKTVDCEVIDSGFEGKDNFVLGVYCDGKRFNCGRVSGLTGDGPRIKIGDVVEVRCLYVSNSFKLFQPTLPRIRTDKQPHECTFDQLEVLRTNKKVIEA